jgi:hypothetical protein
MYRYVDSYPSCFPGAILLLYAAFFGPKRYLLTKKYIFLDDKSSFKT